MWSKEYTIQYNRQWYRKNRDSVLSKMAKQYRENVEAFRLLAHQRYISDKEARIKEVIKWRKANPDKVKRYAIKSNKKHRLLYRKKVTAVDILHGLTRTGKIIRPTLCSRCGKTGKIEGHHFDYDRPKEVIWLCHSCHTKIHPRKSKYD
jgi:hypothetical protein